MKKRIITVIVLIVIFLAIIFLTSPNLNPIYGEGLAFWSFVISVFSLSLMMFTAKEKAVVYQQDGTIRYNVPKKNRVYLIVAAAPWAVLILLSIYSSALFHVNVYKNQMPEPEVREFSSDVQPIDVSQLPVVDTDLASLLADKKLGESTALGSRVTLGAPTIQKINGKLVWAVPLEHSGFFKWASYTEGTPGYILVSATNPRDVTYVEDYLIKYPPKAFFFDQLERHVRLAGGFFNGLTDYSFEINDDGEPYWVITTYKNLTGIRLPEADGVIIINATTGETKRYSMSDVPAWVDRVQPIDFDMTQIDNRGRYIHGLFNFSNRDKFQTSEGSAIVYNNDRCYLYTGLTSVGTDESTIGFILVDMVTKTPYLYQIGARDGIRGPAVGRGQGPAPQLRGLVPAHNERRRAGSILYDAQGLRRTHQAVRLRIGCGLYERRRRREHHRRNLEFPQCHQLFRRQQLHQPQRPAGDARGRHRAHLVGNLRRQHDLLYHPSGTTGQNFLRRCGYQPRARSVQRGRQREAPLYEYDEHRRRHHELRQPGVHAKINAFIKKYRPDGRYFFYSKTRCSR
jgi:hypothetical protein